MFYLTYMYVSVKFVYRGQESIVQHHLDHENPHLRLLLTHNLMQMQIGSQE